jgi:hypothetical protein
VLDIFMLRFVFVVTVFISNISYALSDGRAPMPLPESRAEIYAYYKLGWLADGYPGKYTDNGLVAHPIYGTYVIYDYLREYKRTADSRYLDAAASVARAGASRMEDVGDALVFYYRPESGLTPLPDKFYSALTQSRWLDAFSKIYELNGDLYFRDMANKVFLSLSIPVDQGGVLKEVQGGVSIEEYPHKVPLYTLNGWLTALNIIIEYADRSGNLNARGLIDGNLHALRKMLPLYDLPALSNSRYQLANVAKIKFTGVKVVDVKVEIPGEGVFPLDDVQGVGRQWSNYLYPLSGAQGLHAVLEYHLDVGVEGIGRIEEGVVQRLGCAVEHHVDGVVGEDVFQAGAEFGVITVKGGLAAGQGLDQVVFGTDEEVVDHHHVSGTFGQQAVHQVAADEAGAARDQNTLARKTFSNRHA